MSDTRNRQVMVRLSDDEYAALIHAAEAEDRKPADMLRHYMKRAHAANTPAQQVSPPETPEPHVTPRLKTAPAKRRA